MYINPENVIVVLGKYDKLRHAIAQYRRMQENPHDVESGGPNNY